MTASGHHASQIVAVNFEGESLRSQTISRRFEPRTEGWKWLVAHPHSLNPSDASQQIYMDRLSKYELFMVDKEDHEVHNCMAMH
jgi:hypothetical protein